jgi:hypothetical protein
MRFDIFWFKTFGEFVIFFMFHDAILVVRNVEGRDYSKAAPFAMVAQRNNL